MTRDLILGEHYFRSAPAYSLRGTSRHTFAALDALGVADVLDIHLTLTDAQTAVGTALSVDLYANDRELVEKTVKRAKRAEEAAEESEDEHARHNDGDHQKELPGEERAEHTKIAAVDLVGEQSHRALERSRGADVLTEAGQGEIPERVGDREYKYEEHKDHVLEIGKHASEFILLELWCRDLVQ